MAHLIPFLVREDSLCVDVGANAGAVLSMMIDAAPNGTFVAFEPLPRYAQQLAVTFPAVDVRDVAVAAQIGEATFHEVVEDQAMSGLYEQEYPRKMTLRDSTVRTSTLDEELRGTSPSLIKIDVEGAECDVLDGGHDVVAEALPWMIIEHYAGAASGGGSPERLHGQLTELGYDVLDIDGGGPYTSAELRSIYDRRRLWTFVARPRSSSGKRL